MTRTMEAVRNALEFLGWLRYAKRGSRCVYHTGWLIEDRCHDEELDKLAHEVWEAYERDQVVLVQQRVPGVLRTFLYIAVRRQDHD